MASSRIRPLAFVLLGGAAFVGLACSLVVNLDGLSAHDCGNDAVCRVGVPSGWDGPLLDVDGPADGGCSAPFTNPSFGTLSTDVDGGASQCACACGTDVNGPCRYAVDVYMSDTCSGGPLATNFQLDVGCTALVGKGTGGLLFLDAGPGEGGCVGTLTESRPPPSTRAHHLCGGAFLATNCASDELCVPRSAPTICVSRTGDNPCPAAYPRKKLEFGSLAEGRGCAPCTCTPAPKACSGPPRVTTRSGCDAGGAASLKTSGTCVGGALLGTLDLELPDGACTLTKDTAPTGTVVGADPVTVCCTP